MIQDMEGQAYQDFSHKVLTEIGKIDTWLRAASSYVEKSKIQNLTQNASNALKDIANPELSNAYAKLDNAYNDILRENNEVVGQKLIAEGYMLMNSIGESLRGDKINYSVTIPYSGTYITWTGSMEEFIGTWDGKHYVGGMISFSPSRMVLKKKTTLLNQYKNNVEPNLWKKWDKEKTQIYDAFKQRFNNGNINENKWSKVNQGNMLEAFSRFYDNNISNDNPNAILAQIDSGYLDDILEEAMSETLSNIDPFWTGGDIENEQLKGAGASVTNLSQLIYQLNHTRTLMHSILLKGPQPSKNRPQISGITKAVEKQIEKDIDKLVKELFSKFGA